ncbi:hypothetical protein ACX93W_23095 [Paenibacillus sp. CAU 1782]
MDNRNFVNSNEIYPILDLVRREMQKAGLYTGSQDTVSLANTPAEANVINVEVRRELAGHETLVTSFIYTYDNGMLEVLTLNRDEQNLVDGFLIELTPPPRINTELEEETDIASFRSVRGTIIRENGLFKNLVLDYVRTV